MSQPMDKTRMKHVLRLLTGLALLMSWMPTLSNAQQQPPMLTLDRPIELHVRQATLMLVVGMLSVQKDIPIGIEFSANEKNEPKLEIDVKKAPLVEVLNLIVQQEPAYVWEFRDGVINFTPAKDRDPFFEKLLNTQFVSLCRQKATTNLQSERLCLTCLKLTS